MKKATFIITSKELLYSFRHVSKDIHKEKKKSVYFLRWSWTLLFFFLPSLWKYLGMGFAFACSVCKGGYTKPELDAYLLTIIILGSLPLIICVTLFSWIYHKNSSKKEVPKSRTETVTSGNCQNI